MPVHVTGGSAARPVRVTDGFSIRVTAGVCAAGPGGGRSWILTGSLRLRVRLSPASFDSGPRRRSAPSHSPSPGGRGGRLVPTRSRFAGTALASDCSRRPPCPTPPSREPAGCPAARPPPFNQCNTDQRIIEFTAAIMIAAGAAAQSLLIPRRIESRRRRQRATCASSFLPSSMRGFRRLWCERVPFLCGH